MLWFSQCSSAGRIAPSTAAIISGLFSRSLVCPWNCGSAMKSAQHAGEPFADVVGGERHALRREVVRLDEIAHRLADSGAQAVLVRAARGGGDAVDVAADVLVGGLGPLQDAVEPEAVLPGHREGRFVHGLRATLGDDLSQVLDEPFLVRVEGLLARALVLEGDLQSLVQEARDLESLADDRRVELDLREDRRVGMEVDRRSRCRGRGRSSSAAPWACPA